MNQQISFDVAEYIAYNAERFMDEYPMMSQPYEGLVDFVERRVMDLMADKYTTDQILEALNDSKVSLIIDFYFNFEVTNEQ